MKFGAINPGSQDKIKVILCFALLKPTTPDRSRFFGFHHLSLAFAYHADLK